MILVCFIVSHKLLLVFTFIVFISQAVNFIERYNQSETFYAHTCSGQSKAFQCFTGAPRSYASVGYNPYVTPRLCFAEVPLKCYPKCSNKLWKIWILQYVLHGALHSMTLSRLFPHALKFVLCVVDAHFNRCFIIKADLLYCTKPDSLWTHYVTWTFISLSCWRVYETKGATSVSLWNLLFKSKQTLTPVWNAAQGRAMNLPAVCLYIWLPLWPAAMSRWNWHFVYNTLTIRPSAGLSAIFSQIFPPAGLTGARKWSRSEKTQTATAFFSVY